MACNTNYCVSRTLESTASGILYMGYPLSIVLHPVSIIDWYDQPYTECVLSFIAVQKSTDTLVVVTVGDLLTPNPTIASERTDLQNTVTTIYDGFNLDYYFSYYNGSRDYGGFIGTLAAYNPLYKTPVSGPVVYNQVNAGFIYPDGYKGSGTSQTTEIYSTADPSQLLAVSWQNSYGMSPVSYPLFSEPPTFATTAEVDAITTTTEIMILGYEQLKQGDCGVKIDSVNTSYTFSLSGITGTFPFNHLLSFTRIDPACGNPVMEKDKGGTILAFINDTWKIIGIVIGFNGATGYGSRIDYIADQLGIEAWDGSLKAVTNTFINSPEDDVNPFQTIFKTKPGLDNIVSFTENNILYKQIGITDSILP